MLFVVGGDVVLRYWSGSHYEHVALYSAINAIDHQTAAYREQSVLTADDEWSGNTPNANRKSYIRTDSNCQVENGSITAFTRCRSAVFRAVRERGAVAVNIAEEIYGSNEHHVDDNRQ